MGMQASLSTEGDTLQKYLGGLVIYEDGAG